MTQLRKQERTAAMRRSLPVQRLQFERLEERQLLAAALRGNVWFDSNGGTIPQGGEAPLPGWTVYLDRDDSGTLDPGEESAVTGAQGQFAFENLAPGPYTVRQVNRSGWQQTFPGPAQNGAHSVVLAYNEVRTNIWFGKGPPASRGARF